jgi:apolipoprotein N-acyltransferase
VNGKENMNGGVADKYVRMRHDLKDDPAVGERVYWQNLIQYLIPSLIAGSIAGFGFNSFNMQQACLYWYAPLLTLGGFAIFGTILHHTQRPLMSAYCFGLAYHATSLFWVGSAFDYTTIPFVKPVVSSALALCLATQFPLAIWLATRYQRGAFTLKWVSIFAALDFLRTLSPLFFPWNPMGFIAGDFCLSSIRWWGILGLSWFMLLTSQMFYLANRWRVILGIMLGALYADHYLYQKKPTGFTMLYGRIVQPCIAQDFKWQREKVSENVETFRILSNESAAKKLDFILWPESALPVYFSKDINELAFLTPEHVPLIVGHVHVVNQNRVCTSLSCVDRQAGIRSTYQKRFLVPFGEYIPLPFIDRIIPLITQQKMGIKSGIKRQILDLSAAGLPNAHALICYESIFPQTIFNYQKWIIGVSNDAWFGTSSGPYQHLRWNQIRCLENNMPMMRSTNHGISAVIDSRGRLVKWLGLNQCGIVDCHVPVSSGPSLYNRLRLSS